MVYLYATAFPRDKITTQKTQSHTLKNTQKRRVAPLVEDRVNINNRIGDSGDKGKLENTRKSAIKYKFRSHISCTESNHKSWRNSKNCQCLTSTSSLIMQKDHGCTVYARRKIKLYCELIIKPLKLTRPQYDEIWINTISNLYSLYNVLEYANASIDSQPNPAVRRQSPSDDSKTKRLGSEPAPGKSGSAPSSYSGPFNFESRHLLDDHVP